MALTNVQKNVLDEMQNLAKEIIAIKTRARNVVEMYSNEGLGSLTDADIQSLTSFEGVTAVELQQAKTSLDTVSTAIGEYVVGTPATRLLRICDNIPIS